MSEIWAAEDEATLRKLCVLDLSASQIASRMAFPCTRNAVISKVRRLGLKLYRAASETRQPKRYAKKKQTRQPAEPVARMRQSAPHLPPPVPYVSREAAPAAPATSFDDRRPGQCAWPVSIDKPYRYCGSDKQPGKRRNGRRREYCEAHERLRVTRGSIL